MTPPRRLLLLTQHFPPSAEVAGKPTARLVRHLGRFGWDATVLTIAESDIVGPIDRRAYADVLAAVPVERVARWPRMLDVLQKARAAGRRSVKANGAAPPPAEPAADFTWASKAKRSRLLRYLMFPDGKSGWVAPAALRARALLAGGAFDAFLTVSPPHSTHMAGLLIRRFHPSLPWVAQFHDPWIDFEGPGEPEWLLRRAAAYLERQVIAAADEVLLATDEAAARYAARYPGILSGKAGVLVNGYDEADFPPMEARRSAPGEPLRFVHLGTIYGGRNPLPFLRGLAGLIGAGSLRRDEVRVELVGDCEPLRAVQQVIAEGGLQGVVTVTGQVDHAEALRRMLGADVLLLLAQGQPYQIPAKLYEYLHAGRFVLAFTEGGSARVIEETGAGRVVAPGDDGVQALRDIIELHRSGRLAHHTVARAKLQAYQAPYLAEGLAVRLDALVEGRHAHVAAG